MTLQKTRKPNFQERLDIICDDQGISHGRGKFRALAKIMGLTPPRVSQLYKEGERAKVGTDTINALSKLGHNPRWVSMGESPKHVGQRIDQENKETNKNALDRANVGTQHRETLTTNSEIFPEQEQNLTLQQVAKVLEAVCKSCGYSLDEVYAAQAEWREHAPPKLSVRVTSEHDVQEALANMLGKKSPLKAGNQAGG